MRVFRRHPDHRFGEPQRIVGKIIPRLFGRAGIKRRDRIEAVRPHAEYVKGIEEHDIAAGLEPVARRHRRELPFGIDDQDRPLMKPDEIGKQQPARFPRAVRPYADDVPIADITERSIKGRRRARGLVTAEAEIDAAITAPDIAHEPSFRLASLGLTKAPSPSVACALTVSSVSGSWTGSKTREWGMNCLPFS